MGWKQRKENLAVWKSNLCAGDRKSALGEEGLSYADKFDQQSGKWNSN